ncbi:CHAT domain-containing protein [Pyxidicoccus sp. MSG2]|uniref:CHAT domain-containing protein n=1 Tax=Pyxidicoccus sp. MSG2 TaxID=2996790 RepID=UPI0022702CD1|nr:CHAT domain-containing protein [Pyxidicoccus sp. MSG2]MCY1021038.1 CHAT domain-containing protein [Pyxidicoccus sp. MSG2]
MSELCARLEHFVDGELPPVDAENFRHHLTRCATCESKMKELLAMELLADDALNVAGEAPATGPVVIPGPPAWRRKTWLMMVPLALAAGLATLVLVSRVDSQPDANALWLAQAPTRSMEARLTHPGADRYRPHEVMRSEGSAPRPLPMREMAQLEKAGDSRGVAMAFLLRGDVGQASAHLGTLPPSPDLDSDQAVLALQRKDWEGALTLLEHALKAKPQHPQALWNRGLALQGLGLWLKAAESFEQVAALKEPGWSQEAEQRARQLREKAEQERKDWKGTKQDCDEMVSGQTLLTEQQVQARPGLSRLCLYDAMRAAASAERVEALRPLAVLLDRKDGGTHLEDAVRRAARRDFRVRAPLAAEYARLTRGQLKPEELESFLTRLRDARQEDILLGALLFVKDARKYEQEYRELALATRDPWFALLAEEQQARADVLRGQATRAKERLGTALRACGGDGQWNYRCLELHRQLAEVEVVLHHPVEARIQALAGLERARRGNEWAKELRVVQELGQIARYHGRLYLARAYLEDALLRMPVPCSDPKLTELAHTNLALAFYRIHDFASAREQIDRVARCGQPPELPRAFVIADLAHTEYRREGDAELLSRGLEVLRTSLSKEAGEQPLLKHIEGRFVIEQDRRRGQALLRQAITDAAPLLGSDGDARKARAYSYTSLILDAARHGELELALNLFAEERGLPVPERCTLGVTVDDERTAVVVRDTGGRLMGGYSTGRREPLTTVEGLVPSNLVEALRACPSVDVLARPPVQGQAGLLPPEIAWTYRVGGFRAHEATSPARRLVVADVVPPPEMHLPALRTWSPLESETGDITLLKGISATPSHVLEALRDTTEVQIHAHGIIAPDEADGSMLVLSPEAESGRFALTASDLQGQQLQGRPVVLLAACHAAYSQEYFHETFGLPVAFIEAGARAVLAATQEIPDSEVSAFFEPVLARIREGVPAALVLRDARQDWLRGHGGTWVRQVLLFQ